MSILEILEAHQLNSRHLLCACGDDVSPVDGADWLMDEVYSLHRAHVAQVLEQHEREAKAGAVEGTAKYLRKRFKRVDNPEHIFGANLAIMLIAEHAEEIRNPS